MIHRCAAVALLALICGASAAAAQSVVVVVRHAERADIGMAAGRESDPPLSDAGKARAARLAEMLRSEHIRKVFATEFKRTRQTAEPTARAQHVEIETIPAKNPAALVARLRSADGAVVVVAHSDKLADILKGLGVKHDVKIGETEYDNLFVVVRPAQGAPVLVRLRY
jgi:phosphohistidine phosphatase SixA